MSHGGGLFARLLTDNSTAVDNAEADSSFGVNTIVIVGAAAFFIGAAFMAGAMVLAKHMHFGGRPGEQNGVREGVNNTRPMTSRSKSSRSRRSLRKFGRSSSRASKVLPVGPSVGDSDPSSEDYERNIKRGRSATELQSEELGDALRKIHGTDRPQTRSSRVGGRDRDDESVASRRSRSSGRRRTMGDFRVKDASFRSGISTSSSVTAGLGGSNRSLRRDGSSRRSIAGDGRMIRRQPSETGSRASRSRRRSERSGLRRMESSSSGSIRDFPPTTAVGRDSIGVAGNHRRAISAGDDSFQRQRAHSHDPQSRRADGDMLLGAEGQGPMKGGTPRGDPQTEGARFPSGTPPRSRPAPQRPDTSRRGSSMPPTPGYGDAGGRSGAASHNPDWFYSTPPPHDPSVRAPGAGYANDIGRNVMHFVHDVHVAENADGSTYSPSTNQAYGSPYERTPGGTTRTPMSDDPRGLSVHSEGSGRSWGTAGPRGGVCSAHGSPSAARLSPYSNPPQIESRGASPASSQPGGQHAARARPMTTQGPVRSTNSTSSLAGPDAAVRPSRSTNATDSAAYRPFDPTSAGLSQTSVTILQELEDQFGRMGSKRSVLEQGRGGGNACGWGSPASSPAPSAVQPHSRPMDARAAFASGRSRTHSIRRQGANDVVVGNRGPDVRWRSLGTMGTDAGSPSASSAGSPSPQPFQRNHGWGGNTSSKGLTVATSTSPAGGNQDGNFRMGRRSGQPGAGGATGAASAAWNGPVASSNRSMSNASSNSLTSGARGVLGNTSQSHSGRPSRHPSRFAMHSGSPLAAVAESVREADASPPLHQAGFGGRSKATESSPLRRQAMIGPGPTAATNSSSTAVGDTAASSHAFRAGGPGHSDASNCSDGRNAPTCMVSRSDSRTTSFSLSPSTSPSPFSPAPSSTGSPSTMADLKSSLTKGTVFSPEAQPLRKRVLLASLTTRTLDGAGGGVGSGNTSADGHSSHAPSSSPVQPGAAPESSSPSGRATNGHGRPEGANTSRAGLASALSPFDSPPQVLRHPSQQNMVKKSPREYPSPTTRSDGGRRTEDDRRSSSRHSGGRPGRSPVHVPVSKEVDLTQALDRAEATVAHVIADAADSGSPGQVNGAAAAAVASMMASVRKASGSGGQS